jgi:two-component system, OmpR family, sensor histidine kinase BaeS
MKVRGAWLSLPGKLTLLAGATQLGILVAMLAIIGATDDNSIVRIALFALVLSPPLFIVYFVGRFIVKRMTQPLITAYDQLAAGDFATQLPPWTGGTDFAAVRAAFAGMARALEESLNALREADLDRRRLFADLAHELATPTTTLLGIAHALRSPDTDTARMLDHLERETGRLERLISDVREIAHLEDPALAMHLEECDLGDIVGRVVDRIRLASPNVTVRFTPSATPAKVDPLRIDQVVTNLLDNAARYAANGGIVSVALTTRNADHHITIEDSGSGVPDDVLPQLGRRMLRLDPSRARSSGGHGLGLSIVCVIVERHGGDVTFGRASLGGLLVDVRLPAL